MEFEWDPRKAAANLRKHSVPFGKATLIFGDPARVDEPEISEDYGEERWTTIGFVEEVLLTVVYTVREDRIRLISARKATRHERRIYRSGEVST